MKLSKESKAAARKVADIVTSWFEKAEWPNEWTLQEAMDDWHNDLTTRWGINYQRLREIIGHLSGAYPDLDPEFQALITAAEASTRDVERGDNVLEDVLIQGDLYGLEPRENALAVDSFTFDYEEPMDADTWGEIQEIYREAAEVEGYEPDDYAFKKAFETEVNDLLDDFIPPFDTDVTIDAWVHVEPGDIPVYLYLDTLAEALATTVKDYNQPTERLFEIGNDSDGRYDVYRLSAEDLGAEGAMQGICIGQPSMGYGEAIRSGELQVLSVRTKKGRPKFTVSLEMDGDEIVGVDQVKGKANRLPGYKGRDKKIARAEINVLTELFEKLGIDPWQVEDMVPALRDIEREDREKSTRSNPSRTFDEPYRPRSRRRGNPTRTRTFDEPYNWQ